MDKDTLIALEGSIKKWDRIVKSTKAIDNGSNNCPLCWHVPIGCFNCPVDIHSDHGCNGTPYEEWREHHERVHGNYSGLKWRVPYCKECLRLARKERDFLKSLLPQD